MPNTVDWNDRKNEFESLARNPGNLPPDRFVEILQSLQTVYFDLNERFERFDRLGTLFCQSRIIRRDNVCYLDHSHEMSVSSERVEEVTLTLDRTWSVEAVAEVNRRFQTEFRSRLGIEYGVSGGAGVDLGVISANAGSELKFNGEIEGAAINETQLTERISRLSSTHIEEKIRRVRSLRESLSLSSHAPPCYRVEAEFGYRLLVTIVGEFKFVRDYRWHDDTRSMTWLDTGTLYAEDLEIDVSVDFHLRDTVSERLTPCEVCDTYYVVTESGEIREVQVPGAGGSDEGQSDDEQSGDNDGDSGNDNNNEDVRYYDQPPEFVLGIGPVYADRLRQKGIVAIGQLVEQPVEQLAYVLNTSEERAKMLKQRAENRIIDSWRKVCGCREK